MSSKFSVFAGEAAKAKIGQRGKTAERELRQYLERLERARANFVFERRYDARSAGGRFPSQAGDFGYYTIQSGLYLNESKFVVNESVNGLIEVKEVDHDFRLPQKNFSKERIARCALRELAGTQIVVLILHTTTGKWRRPAFDLFKNNPAVPSWDLSQWPEYDTVNDAVRGIPSLTV